MSDRDDFLARLASVEDEFTLLPTATPLVLLPVRIETRFTGPAASPVLRVRIYPDEIFADSLEPLLTEDELELGVGYWRRPARSPEAMSAWHALVRKHGAARAAWIVRQTKSLAGFQPPPLGPLPPSQGPIGLGQEGPPGLGGGFFGGDTGGATSSQPVPRPPTRAASFTTAVKASALPDCWRVHVQLTPDPASTLKAQSALVRLPLALTLDPSAQQQGPAGPVDDGLRWTIDYARALEAGMAVDVPLPANTVRVERVLVFGARASLDAAGGAAALGQLFTSHHYTRGVGFLPQGTATTNTASVTCGAPNDPLGDLRWQLELGDAKALLASSAGPSAAAAFGTPAELFSRVENAELDEATPAAAMAGAIWPATLGYFFRQCLPILDAPGLEALRQHFQQHVRGRGPLTALRIGNVPYGVLPVSSLDAWAPDAGDAPAGLSTALRKLHDIFRDQLASAPHLGKSGDADRDLLEVLGQDASAREVRVRRMMGPDFQAALARYSTLLNDSDVFDLADPDGTARKAISAEKWSAELVKQMQPLLTRLGLGSMPWIARAMVEAQASLYAGALVGDAAPAYLAALTRASLADLMAGQLTGGPEPSALLYRVLRQSVLLQALSSVLAAMDAAGDPQRPPPSQRAEQELPGLRRGFPNGWDLLRALRSDSSSYWDALQRDPAFHAVTACIGQLAARSDLEPLFTEALDTCSHRLDAWITSLATRRLRAMRGAGASGCLLGAYGWAEDVRRDSTARFASGGYVHAPSMAHASAAAVLRNARIGRLGAGGAASPYALSLSSREVRAGRQFLDLVRAGLSAGEVLGFALEEALHRPEWQAKGRLQYLEPLRQRFPLAERAGDAAARAVVDGLALLQALRDGRMDWSAPGLPTDDAGRAALAADLLAILHGALDPAADLLTAESVFQTVRGNHPGAAASLDALARGTAPPDPEVARSARGGTPVVQRIAIELDTSAPSADAWPQPLTPRAAAQPHLDRWAAALLGDPAAIVCTAFDGAGNASTVSLAALGLRPLDFIALAAEEGAASELAARALDAAGSTAVRVDLAAISPADRARAPTARSFADASTAARAALDVLGRARALRAVDLLPPGAAVSDEPSPEASAAAQAALAALGAAADDLAAAIGGPPAALGPLLRRASLFGVAGAFVPAATDASLLPARAPRVLTELRARYQTASTGGLAPADVMAAIFGRALPYCAPFSLPAEAAQSLQAALGAAATLFDGGARRAPALLARWLRDAARVRPALDALRRLSLLSRALGRGAQQLALAQLPLGASTRWAGADPKPPSGLACIVFDRSLAAPAAATVLRAGLLVDEWTETAPNQTEHTGVAFHRVDAGSEAPQAILIAVPPDRSKATWSADGLAQVLAETLELAKLRALDLEVLSDLGQLLPGICLASNPDNAALGVRFAPGELRREEQP